MSARRAVAAIVLAAACGVASLFGVAPHTAAAVTANGDNQAVVVVDLGNGDVRSACVRFRQASITGLDLLRAARTDPVVQAYSGNGGAVCKLCGVGCSAGGACLTCQSPKYWQYWRSQGGSGTYTYSSSGADSTKVSDGDVDGWSWGSSKKPPPFLTVAEACSGPNVYRYEPTAATTTSTSTTDASGIGSPGSTAPAASSSPGPASPKPAPAAGGAPSRATTTSTNAQVAASGEAATTSSVMLDPSSPPTTLVLAGGKTGSGAQKINPRRGSGSSVLAFALFAVLLTVIVGRTVQLRRKRARS